MKDDEYGTIDDKRHAFRIIFTSHRAIILILLRAQKTFNIIGRKMFYDDKYFDKLDSLIQSVCIRSKFYYIFKQIDDNVNYEFIKYLRLYWENVLYRMITLLVKKVQNEYKTNPKYAHEMLYTISKYIGFQEDDIIDLRTDIRYKITLGKTVDEKIVSEYRKCIKWANKIINKKEEEKLKF